MKLNWFKWWHVLLLAWPGAWIAWWLNRQPASSGQFTLMIFALALVALVPLATLIGEATDILAYYLGDLAGGLLSASLSNVPELTIGVFLVIQAVRQTTPEAAGADIDIIRGLLVGSVVNNVLLTLGLSVFIGALRNGRMNFNAENASGYASMLALAVVGLALPTLAHAFNHDALPSTDVNVSLLVAGVLLVTYVLYIGSSVFHLGESPSKTARAAARKQDAKEDSAAQQAYEEGIAAAGGLTLPEPGPAQQTEVEKLITAEEEDEAKTEAQERSMLRQRRLDEPGKLLGALVLLIVVTLGTVTIAGLLVSVTDNVIRETPLTPLSTGFILFPIVCNIGEAASALVSGWKNRMELAMSVAAGSSVQVPLFVTSVLVLVSFLIARGNAHAMLTLVFTPLELIVVGLATFVYALVNLDGETTWLEGLQLLAFYAMIAVTAFALPGI